MRCHQRVVGDTECWSIDLAGIFVTRPICHHLFLSVGDNSQHVHHRYANHDTSTAAHHSGAGCASCHRHSQLLRHAQQRCRRCSSCSRYCHSTAPDLPDPQSGCQCNATVAQLDIRASSSAEVVKAAVVFPGLQRALGRPKPDSPIWRHHGTHHHTGVLPPAGLQRIHLRVAAGTTTMRIRHKREQTPCLTDIRCYTSTPAG